MEILDTLVSNELTQISLNGIIVGKHRWELVVHANGREIRPLYTNSLKLDRHYAENFADQLSVSATFVPLDVMKYIIPYKENLEISLIKRPLGNGSMGGQNMNIAVSSSKYNAHLINSKSPQIEGDSPLVMNQEAAKNVAMQSLEFQLYNPVIDFIRKKTFRTVFRKNTPMVAIGYILMKMAKPSTSPDNNAIKGINIVPGYKDEVREHIPIKEMTPLLQCPFEINNIVGGIYPTGFHFYLQNQIWHVYPPYDTKRFGTSNKTLTVIKIPQGRMPSMERTYRKTDTQVILLTTRETKHYDISETKQLNQGNAVAFVQASKIMDGFYKQGDNKAVTSLKQTGSFVYSEKRNDGNMFTADGAVITNDYNKVYTNMALKSGAIIQTQWENADPSVLTPSMPVRYIYTDGKTIREVYGTLLAVETLDYQHNVNKGENAFSTIALLTLFVDRTDPSAQIDPNKVTNSTTVNDQ